MHLLELPNEVLLKILDYGSPDALLGGPSQTCRLLRELSDDPQLWHRTAMPQLRDQYLTPRQIDNIPDLREWCLRQRSFTKRTVDLLNELSHEFRDATPQDLEIYTWRVLKQRLRAREGLELACQQPRNIAHYFWAHWLTDVMYHLEGLHMLLKLSTRDNWGNGIVENPIDQFIALHTLRYGQYPGELFDAVYRNASADALVDVRKLGSTDIVKATEVVVTEIYRIFDKLSIRNDFLTVLGRGSLFITLWGQCGLQSRLLKLPFGSYVCILPQDPLKSPPFFVDFQRMGKLRSLDDVRERLQAMGVVDVQYGVSLYDTLSTAYVWHSAPTPTRNCVLDLIEHAANEAKTPSMRAAPKLYSNLVHRIIKGNIAEVENAPLSRSVSSASLASIVPPRTKTWLRKGEIVEVQAPLSQETHSTDRFGVILDVRNDTVLVQINSFSCELRKCMVRPPSFISSTTTVEGLEVPNINVDLMYLGQYFENYDPANERFE